ncbi:thioredoxin fold domain-containing protein [Pedobacter sp. PF22-3]|uniref:thioredoxin fold domain-containing protein n=1 Tax=Pedobacter sp. PF22-3 TaxID=2994467 RepID=UPI002246D3AB|nr:thioredoxin fold domain-containing protein [Pedobacter sp. PF22-3]MCX2492196.1 thioredoxin fold domain-containing protein [Pedobacter sp. PF22-3]
MKKLFLIFLLLPFIGSAQVKGTHFEHGLSWRQVKEKAKKENKFLLVDCFTTWCGPCKYMASTIFPQEKVGEFFNKNFVNVKVQFDQTKNDSEEVKSWYADAKAMSKEFKINAYPTFLIFSPQGALVHRIVGGGEADEFIARAQMALNPETQYYTLLKKSESGNPTPQTLKQLAVSAEAAYDEENSEKFANAYLDTQKDLYTKENLEFISRYTRSTKSKGFELMLKDPEKIDAILGKGKSNKILSNIILEENIYPALRKPNVNIDSLVAAVQAKYPKVDINEPTDLIKIQVFQSEKKWDKFQPAVLSYMKKYGTEVRADMLNSFAWTVFENCKDTNCITEALSWSKRSVDETQSKEPSYLDTYANLLYKLGKKDQAIAMQQKAVDLVAAENKAQYQVTLDKMKKGE